MIIVDEIISVDGFAARPDNGIDFFVDIDGLVDSVGDTGRMKNVAAVLLGARTYAEFAAYWPYQDPAASVNRLPKHVLSRSLTKAPWGSLAPATVERGEAADVARGLDASYDGDIIVWGSLSVAQSLLRRRMVDEIWLRMVPIALGDGRSFFPDQDLPLTGVEVATAPGGWLTIRYRV